MKVISEKTAQEFLGQARIKVAKASLGIGKELVYQENTLRSIVIHLPEKYGIETLKIILCILEFDNKWLLFTRYGSVSDLGILMCSKEIAAIEYESSERTHLAQYLCTRPIDLALSSADLYIIGLEGKILITWDHHTAKEGLSIDLESVTIASRML